MAVATPEQNAVITTATTTSHESIKGCEFSDIFVSLMGVGEESIG